MARYKVTFQEGEEAHVNAASEKEAYEIAVSNRMKEGNYVHQTFKSHDGYYTSLIPFNACIAEVPLYDEEAVLNKLDKRWDNVLTELAKAESCETSIDLSTLDEGIRDIVELLQGKGFNTTDSGDGSKYGKMEGALPYPHVIIKADPIDVKEQALALAKILPEWEVEYNVKVGDPLAVIYVSLISDAITE